MDLEWNQAMSSKSSVFNYLPIHLRGEIIQIGAVKLNDDWTPAEEFQIDVKPVYFRKMHYKVKKLTGIDGDRLSHAPGFVEAFEQFRAFCGDGATFLTWGYDDKGIMEQNIIVHDQDWDWIDGWINLQLIYNMQTDGDKNQKALSTAMEHFGIEQTRVAHDALGDAYNTALICSHLDMEDGLRRYADAAHQLALRRQERAEHAAEAAGPEPLEHLTFTGYASRSAAFDDESLRNLRCPVCGEALRLQKWVNQGDRRYMTVGACETHGSYLVRVKLKLTEEETWTVNRILYEADEGMLEFYQHKSVQSRRRNRRRKKSAAEVSNK
ncbi:MAG: exonuclease domain-containing protein [Oscillospiraceae bacterium]|nr:exonuclease domain-containing protein [Oscillospiraceae bacterium]